MFLTLFASIGLILGPTLPAKAAPCAAVTHARSSPPCLELQLGMVDWGVQTPPSDTQLATIKGTWGTWGCGISTFPWTYSDEEWCFILEGEVTVTPDDADKFGGPKQIKQGDYVLLPKGMSCTWDVTKAIEKHYSFDGPVA